MSVCNCVISVKKCFLSSNNGFLRFCQGKTHVPIKNYILNSTNRITTVLCQKCIAQQAHIIRASTLHPSSTILLLSYIFLCEQKKQFPKDFILPGFKKWLVGDKQQKVGPFKNLRAPDIPRSSASLKSARKRLSDWQWRNITLIILHDVILYMR